MNLVFVTAQDPGSGQTEPQQLLGKEEPAFLKNAGPGKWSTL